MTCRFSKFNNDNVEEITVQMASDANLPEILRSQRHHYPKSINNKPLAIASDVASYLQQVLQP